MNSVFARSRPLARLRLSGGLLPLRREKRAGMAAIAGVSGLDADEVADILISRSRKGRVFPLFFRPDRQKNDKRATGTF